MAEPTIVKVAERECRDVVPLYYPMAKAGAVQITPESLYNGMVAAWTGGNIGAISNQISKIWASDKPDVDAVKVLCMLNNFVIDYAKTLYKPTIPKEWNERLQITSSCKLPAFFKYAKGKTDTQVEQRSHGVVDRLYGIIQIYKFRFNDAGLGRFDYRMLMYDDDIPYGEKEQKLVSDFRKASSKMKIQNFGMFDDNNHYFYQIKSIRKKFLQYGSLQYVTDVLIRGLFYEHHVRKKTVFFDCFGDQVYENLLNNLPKKTRVCQKCGKRFSIERPQQAYCLGCQPSYKIAEIRTAECVICGATFKTRDALSGAVCPACKAMPPRRRTVNIQQRQVVQYCVDCGMPFDMYVHGRPSKRCDRCQKARNLQKVREWKIKHKKR